ncbi:hypothetical protein WJX81_003934 [Elliptochloris bilobata]|uniref:Thioredoxin domain-containing protein n=1 Tax=Elliptochloris bilobata TaxID=381761 RepID=A0AAW1QHS3_9CHLO
MEAIVQQAVEHSLLQAAREKEFFAEVKGEERVVCHFFRENWPCKVMDKHMEILARKHIETKFIKIHAEKSPFLTERLRVWMLPTLALVKLGKTVDYVIGFADLGGSDDFPTSSLAARLAAAGLLTEASDEYGGGRAGGSGKLDAQRSVRHGGRRGESDEDSDFD